MTPPPMRISTHAGYGSDRQGPPVLESATRLLAGMERTPAPDDLETHLRRFGTIPLWTGRSFVDELQSSGLRGRGGGWFPAAAKWRSVRRSGLRQPVVVANGAEGEPASAKDRFLLTHRPHLVLDGAVLAATTVGADRVILYVARSVAGAVASAVEERRRRQPDRCHLEVVTAPDRYLAGQESAAVNVLNDRAAVPSFVALHPVRQRGVSGRPTLVQNVETLAHAALIARFGSTWFRSVGSQESPGTTLLSVTRDRRGPRILEARLGVPLGDALGVVCEDRSSIQAILLGGYGGGWLPVKTALAMPLTQESARQCGSSVGAGVVALLPTGTCPLLEVSRVVRYMEREGAGQCGPCVNGLGALARVLDLLARRPSALPRDLTIVSALCDLVAGRGACAHPDGVVRFVRSAFVVFDEHVSLHLRRGPCRDSSPPFLPVPSRPLFR